MNAQRKQYLVSIGVVVLMAGICYGISPYLGYRVIAFILLLTVSLIAISYDILPVLLAATLSAFLWNFFFIPPRFNLHIDNADDAILFVMYFVIALINAVLTYKIRQVEKASRKKEEKVKTLKLYDTLLNSLSHELRTPIATIIAATDNLQANQQLAPEQREELVGEIATASFRLNEQVENLLNMSRLESGFIKPKMDWCDLTELVYDLVARIEERPISQRISININPNLPLIKTDKWLLGQVLTNLLNNAATYSYPGSVIKITAMLHVDIVQVVIEDDGPGFPPEEMEHVFDKFYRLKSSKPGGTGLGLSIVKGFVEALRGQVRVENAGGARFTIEIPCETSSLKI